MTTRKIDLTSAEIETIIHSLNCRSNYIETGTVTMSRNDAINQGKSKIVKALSDDQMKVVARQKELVSKLLKSMVGFPATSGYGC